MQVLSTYYMPGVILRTSFNSHNKSISRWKCPSPFYRCVTQGLAAFSDLPKPQDLKFWNWDVISECVTPEPELLMKDLNLVITLQWDFSVLIASVSHKRILYVFIQKSRIHYQYLLKCWLMTRETESALPHKLIHNGLSARSACFFSCTLCSFATLCKGVCKLF